MKKSFIALAVLGAFAGTAAAQTSVTLSGKLGFSVQKNSTGVQGMAVTDGDLRVTASEDLGGGLKATAYAEFQNRGRGMAAAVGRDAAIVLSGGFGAVTVGSVEAGNGIIGRGFAGAPVSLADGFDGTVLAGPSNVDMIQYTTPSMGGLTARINYADSVGAAGAGKGTVQTVLGGVDYNAGPISVGLDFTDFRGTAGNAIGSRTRLSGSYDFGVARVGAGYQKSAGTAAQYALGVNVPFGAFTAGLVYANNRQTNTDGWGVGMNYAFSKRTVLNTSYGKIDGLQNQYRIRLMHSF